MKTLKFLILVLCLALSACATAQQKRQQVISQGVYAVQASIQAGRFDLAKKYSDELTKVVPAPKKKIEVVAIKETTPQKEYKISNTNNASQKNATTQNYVVLPQEFTGYQSLLENSDQLNKIIAENAALKKASEKERKELESYKQNIEKSMNATIAASEEKRSSGIWGWVIASVGGLGIIGSVILCAAFPSLIPLFSNIVTSVVGIINQCISGIAALFKKKE